MEDHSSTCGFGSAVLECAAEAFPEGTPKPIVVLGMPKRFIKHDSRKLQLMEVGLNADNIVRTAKNMLSLSK